jgi:hypothetical protein
VFCVKSLNSVLFSSDETQFIMSVATLCGVIRSVISPGTLWLSSLVSLRLLLRCRGAVTSMYSIFLFLCRDPSGRRDVQVNSSGKGYFVSRLWPSFMDGSLLSCAVTKDSLEPSASAFGNQDKRLRNVYVISPAFPFNLSLNLGR